MLHSSSCLINMNGSADKNIVFSFLGTPLLLDNLFDIQQQKTFPCLPLALEKKDSKRFFGFKLVLSISSYLLMNTNHFIFIV